MANFLGGQPKVIPEFTGLQVNTSVQVLPIPIIYGSPRVNINLIYYNGFYSKKVSTSSGKGVLSGGKGGTEIEYFATIVLAVSEGPVGEPLVIYQDQGVWTPADYPTNGATFFNGTDTQTPWSVVVADWPDDARPFKNTAYYAFSNAQLDASATVPQIDLIVQGMLNATSPLNYTTLTITTGQYGPTGELVSYEGNLELGFLDADPGQVILDFLTDPVHGAKFPAEWVDKSTLLTSATGWDPNTGDTAVSTYCQAVGIGWSAVLNNVESANAILERWTKNLNVAAIWNGAFLRFIPYWDEYANANPGWDTRANIPMKYYTPYTIPICTITLDQILQSDNKDEDPIVFTRKDPMEVYNTVRVDFRDRTNFFNDNVVEAKDEAHIELYGPRIDNIGLATEYTLAAYANVSAQAILARNISIMRTFTWKMGPLWAFLDPMDIVNIPDPVNYEDVVLVRIVSVEDDADENVTVVAEEFPVGSQSPAVIPTSPTTPPNQGITNAPPAPAFKPVMFEPTTDMLTATGFSSPQWIFGDSGGSNGVLDSNWGGCNVWVSLDDVSYEMVGTLIGPSVIGLLTATLLSPSGPNPDNTNKLYVNLNECDGTIASVGASAAAAGHSLCCVQDASGFEILSYTTATLVSSFTYELTGLYRGLYGTTARQFGAGSEFLYVGTGANIVEVNIPASYIGKTFWVKPQSFNIFNNFTLELSEVQAYQYVINGPTPVSPIAPPTAKPPAMLKGGSKSRPPSVLFNIKTKGKRL